MSLVDQSVMYSKYCGVPKQEIDACPTVGWIRDFADPLTVLYVPFYGPAIVPDQQLQLGSGQRSRQINAAMAEGGAGRPNPAARAQAWANVDKMLVDQAVAVAGGLRQPAQHREQERRRRQQLWNDGTWDFAFTSLK